MIGRQGPPPAATPSQRSPSPADLVPPGFADRVMARIAGESPPSLAGTFARSLLPPRFGDARAILGVAWRLAFARSHPVVPIVRLQSLLLILLLGVLLGAGGVLAAGGTLRVIDQIRGSWDAPPPVVLAPGPHPSLAPGARLSAPSASPDGGDRARKEGGAKSGQRGAAPDQGAEQGPASGSAHQQDDGLPDRAERRARQGTPPRGSTPQQRETQPQVPAPDGRRSQASAAPGGAGQAQASPRRGDGARSGS
jgi:hypothetical protein